MITKGDFCILQDRLEIPPSFALDQMHPITDLGPIGKAYIRLKFDFGFDDEHLGSRWRCHATYRRMGIHRIGFEFGNNEAEWISIQAFFCLNSNDSVRK